MKKLAYLLCLPLLLIGCTGIPDGVKPINNFALDRYLGTWYEIARLDHSFERGLEQVSAQYSMNDDGSVKVINRGRDQDTQQWQEAIGKAKFVGEPSTAHLKVSFFGPFYGSYIVFYLEDDYSSALVSGPNKEYFWILSRSKSIPTQQLNEYIAIANDAGFNTSKLIFPTQ
jgi:apolipoprotein D and lipocalin family protein